MLGLAAIALAALVGFYIRQRRASNPLYDLKVAGRRVFWVAACAGVIVFGSLMAAAFVSQQYLQNVLSYSSLEAGAAILPAALVMVLVAPRSAKLVECPRSALHAPLRLRLPSPRVPLDAGGLERGRAVLADRTRVRLHRRGRRARRNACVALPDRLGSPVTRAGMASGTADLQRDLGGAIMQSTFGALLTAGYASAVSAAIAASDREISDSTQAQLTNSFAGAESVAAQHPQYADAIVSGAKQAFLQGDDWAYTAGVVSILLGAVLVFFMFPKKDDEDALLGAYQAEDRRVASSTARVGRGR